MKKIFLSLCFLTSFTFAQNTVTDYDGNSYNYLSYGAQQWTIQNAAMETYSDGTPIPQVTSQSAWTSLTTGAWCYANNNSANTKLYNWYAVAGIHDNDPNTSNKELAPEGWHIPTDAEWTNLEEFLIANGYNYDGSSTGNKIAKAMASTTGWSNSTALGVPGNTQASNNSTNLAFESSGYRHGLYGTYTDQNQNANFWASDQSTFQNPNHPLELYSWVRTLKNNESDLIRYDNEAKDGFSVRFVQDSDSCSEVSITASESEVCAGVSVDLTAISALVAGSTACTSAELPANLQNGLVGYWPFCGNANDASGNGNNGTVTGPTLTSDRLGNSNNAYSFDGSLDEYIVLSSNNIPSSGDFSVAFWINMQSYYLQESDNVEFINLGSQDDTKWGIASNISGDARMNYGKGCNDSGGNSISEVFNLNNWDHFIFVTNNINTQIFKNGVLVGTTENGTSSDCSTTNLYFGTDIFSNQENTEMILDNVAIWDRALTTNEIQLIANDSTFSWSTGDTTQNILVTPTETTDYWVDVTTNGVTCREYITISVTASAAPTGEAEQTFCEVSTVAGLTATGDTIQWYDASIGGNLLDATTALADGQVVYASQIINSCESNDRLEVRVSIQDINITASETEVCTGESVDLTATGTIINNNTLLFTDNFSFGTADLWTNANISAFTSHPEYGNILGTFSSGEQPSFNLPNIENGIYNISFDLLIISTWDGDGNNGPDILSYDLNGLNVFNATFSNLSTELFGYDQEQSYPNNYGDGIHPAGTGSELIALGFGGVGWSFDNGCPSTGGAAVLKYSISNQVIVDNEIINMEIFKNTGQSMCDESWALDNLTITQISETNYSWSTGDTTETISVTPIETTEYWVDFTTNGVTCREYITIDVTSPAAPTANPIQGGCSDFTVGSNNNVFTGENLQWYATPSGGTALPDNHLLVDGTYYYISQTVDGCESSDRFEFLYLAPQPTITIDTPVICEGDSTTVSVSSIPSLGTATFLWNTGETSESITLSPTESTTFWVDQIYNSGGTENIQTVCRYFFGVAVDQAPDSPVSGGDIAECETIAAQNLVATASVSTGQSIVWYDAATGGNVVTDQILSTAGTVTYYAETINDSSGCPSLARTAVTLTITSIDSPTGDSVQSFCDISTIADLTVTGDAIQWYDSATGGILLDNTTALADGQLVYASQTENDCESLDRLGVSVEIDVITDPILITTELDFCLAREATLADLEIDAQGFELEWYDSYTGGTLLGLDTILEDAISYYATLYDVVSGCESLMRLEVIPTVIPCEVIIYNAISINDNGLNDYMVIENAEYFPFNTLEIFNRDGYLVYNQRKYGVGDNLFRGMANVGGIYSQGSNLPTGSYLYVFTYYNPYEQQEFVKKGFLTINNN